MVSPTNDELLSREPDDCEESTFYVKEKPCPHCVEEASFILKLDSAINRAILARLGHRDDKEHDEPTSGEKSKL